MKEAGIHLEAVVWREKKGRPQPSQIKLKR